MKNCPTCDLDFEDEFVFCAEDGSRLEYVVDVPREDSAPKQTASPAIKQPAAVTALHCPVCQVEYPLTFVVCPVDGLLLSREKPQAPKKKEPAHEPAAAKPVDIKPAFVKASVVEPPTVEQTITEQPIVEPTVVIESQPRAEPVFATASGPQETVALPFPVAEEISRVTVRQVLEAVYDEMAGAASRIKSRLSSLRDQASKARESAYQKQADKTEPPNLRLIARLTTIGLSLFVLLVLYSVYDYVTRRPSAKPSVEKIEQVAELSPLIPTPEEARNYKEETDEQTTDGNDIAEPHAVGQAAEATHHGVTKQLLSSPERQTTPSNAERQQKPPSEPRPAAPVVRGPVPSQSTGGRINARLLRVHSSKARPGVRYDLTFVLEEEAGDPVRWERMIISTRSARGLNQSQTIPFSHRQGASGSLTFTVSVQMYGPSEADLRGRVLCTTIGSDPAGRAMRASFGANVAP
ncbi:MAG TPA: hypothetical protein VID27_03315 [Blastocatellia bacterium]